MPVDDLAAALLAGKYADPLQFLPVQRGGLAFGKAGIYGK
jgi:hypothetical protein